MILDTLAHASTYRSLGARFAAGLDWLAQATAQLPDGRITLDGDELFALVQSYETVPAAVKKFESHRAYADIQFLLSGSELVHYAPVGMLAASTDYDARNDYRLYLDPPHSTPLHCSPGTFAIFFPFDGHKPGCAFGAPAPIKKIVLKVRL